VNSEAEKELQRTLPEGIKGSGRADPFVCSSADSPNLTNRYTAVGGVPLAYDAAGNLVQDQDGYHYEYDYENRVTHIYKMNGQTPETVAWYAYDALGRRIWKHDPAAAAANVYYYYNDQWQMLCEYTAETTCRQWFSYGNYIDEVLSRNTHPTDMQMAQYYAHDHLYSPAVLVSLTPFSFQNHGFKIDSNAFLWLSD